jgi:hypothetical protein
MKYVRSHPTNYLVAIALWAIFVAVFWLVIAAVRGPLWLIPLGVILIIGEVVRNWRQYRQYAPLPGLYLMVSSLVGYGFLNRIGKYDFVDTSRATWHTLDCCGWYRDSIS